MGFSQKGFEVIEIIVIIVVIVIWVVWAITCQEQPKQEQPKQEQPKQEQPRQEQPKQEQPRQVLSDYEIDLQGIEAKFFFLRNRCDNETALHQLELEYKKAMRELIRRSIR